MYTLHIKEVDINKKSNISLIFGSVKLNFFLTYTTYQLINYNKKMIRWRILIVIKLRFLST